MPDLAPEVADVFHEENLLDEAKTVDDFVEVVVGVLPGLHNGFFSLEHKN